MRVNLQRIDKLQTNINKCHSRDCELDCDCVKVQNISKVWQKEEDNERKIERATESHPLQIVLFRTNFAKQI